MGIDLTPSFHKLILEKRKSELNSQDERKNQQLFRKHVKAVTTFSSSANNILQNIDNLQKFLNENTKEYVDVYQHMYSHKKQLSDKSRDEIDVETRTILSSTCQQIDQLKATLGDLRAHLNSNTLSHLNGIVTFLYCKLQEVAQYFADQKSLRFKQAFEPKNGYFRLSPIQRKPVVTIQETDSVHTDQAELQLEESERKLLEEENAVVQRELECLVDQTREVERVLMEISELQNILSLKIAQQSEQIEGIFMEAQETKTNLEQATKELRRASEYGVGFRVFVLIFLIVASLALLFLHWIT